MNLSIDLYDVATPEEVKEAALDGIRSLVRQQFSGAESNLNRLIANLSYQYVWKMVDEQFDGQLSDILRTKVVEVVNGLSSYAVFHKKDAWENEDSVAYRALQEEMMNARPLIKERVENIVANYPFDELQRDEIGDVIYECIMGRLFDPRKEK